MSGKDVISLVKETYTRWSDHDAPRLGASVAFYSILSFAPLLVLITAVIALAFGNDSAHAALVDEARQLIGDRGAETVNTLLKNAQKPASGVFASIVAFVTLLFGASGVFTELRDALDIMWDAPKQKESGVMVMLKQRLFSFGMVLSVGFLLLVSLVLSAGLAYLGHSFGEVFPLPPFVLQSINFIVSFAVITVLFALMFKYVPAVQVSWREVIVGAIGTALLFTIGKFLLGIYLGKASVGSTYGAAGSLVAVVVWIYYSAQIFFFGAEFTRVYADRHRVQKAPQDTTSESPSTASKNREQPPPTSKPDNVVPAPAPSYSARPSAPVPIALKTTERRDPRVRFGSGFTSSATKPRLVMAAALGFILGRVTWAVARKRSVN